MVHLLALCCFMTITPAFQFKSTNVQAPTSDLHTLTPTSEPIPESPPSLSDSRGDIYLQRLEREARAVTSRHLRQMDLSDELPPPQLRVQDNFMHSYISNTGTGNRKATTVANVTEEFFIPGDLSGVFRWEHKRFNHSDYLLATTGHNCILWRPDIAQTGRPSLGYHNNIAVVSGQQDRMIDCSFFLRVLEEQETLLMTVTENRDQDKFLYVYEILFDHIVLVARYTLEQSYFTCAFVDTQFGTYFITLNHGLGSATFNFQGKGLTHLADTLTVGLGSPVDLVTFMAGGDVFLAVANTSHCQVVILDDQQVHLFDSLYLPDIVSLSVFQVSSRPHLLVSGRSWQRLYKWRQDGFILVQQLELEGLVQSYVVTVDDCHQDRFLVAVRGPEPLRIFLWVDDHFDEKTGVTFTSVHPLPWSMTSFTDRGDLILLSAEGGRGRAFSVGTTKTPLQNPAVQRGKHLEQLLKEAEDLLLDQERRAHSSWEVLSHAVLSTGSDFFTARQHLQHLEVLGEVVADSLKSDILALHWRGSPLNKDDLRWTTEYLEGILKDMERQLDRMEADIADVVLLDENVVIDGHKTVLGGIRAPEATFEALQVNQAGGKNVDEVINDIYRIDAGQRVTGNKIVKGTVHITGQAELDWVNEVQLHRDVLLTETPQHITGHWRFVSPLHVDGNLDVAGRVNDVKIGAELIPLTTPTVVKGPKDFRQTVHIVQSLQTPRLDGVDLESVALNSLTRSHSQVIHCLPPVLTQGTSPGISELTVTGKVNGLDIGLLGLNTARTDTPADFTGAKLFLEPDFASGLVVFGAYDGVLIPFDIFEPTREQDFKGQKHFAQVRARKVIVHGWTDGLKLESDVATLTGDQEIIAKHFANGIVLNGDLGFGERLDGVTIQDLQNLVTTPQSGREVHAVFFGPVLIETKLVIEQVTGLDLEALKADLVFPEDQQIVFTGKKIFLELEVPKINVRGSVNGYNIKEDFVTIATDQFIKGTKTFTKTTVFANIETGNVDGVDLSELYNNRVPLSYTPLLQPLQGRVTATGVLSVLGDLRVAGTVNGLDIWEDFALVGKTHRLANKVFAGGLSAKDVIVRGDIEVGLLDGVDFDHFLTSRVTLSTDQTLDRSLMFRNVKAGRVESPLVNGMNLRIFADDLMSLTKPQTVSGKKTFTGLVFLTDSAQSSSGLNNRDLNALQFSARRLSHPKPFLNPVTFSDSLAIEGDLTVTDRVNGVDLSDLAERGMKKSAPFRLNGKTTFDAGLHVNGDIVADSVNGLHLPDEILLKNRDQNINGAYTFPNLEISNLHVVGSVNGLDLAELDRTTAKVSGLENVFVGDWDLNQDLQVLEDTVVNGAVNGQPLKDFFNLAVFKDSANGAQIVEGVKVLTGPVTVLGEANVDFLNGVHFTPFLQDVVYIHQDQEITGEKIMQTDVTVRGEFYAGSRLEIPGLVNSIHVPSFAQSVIYLNQPQVLTGDQHFLSSINIERLTTNGRINGIVLHQDTLLQNRNQPQTITGSVSFKEIRTLGNMDVDQTVNGVRLPDLFEDTLLVHGDQTVTGHKELKGPMTLVRSHYGLVNNVDLSEEVYILEDDIEFQDIVVFEESVIIQNDVSFQGKVNDIDLSVLAEEALTMSTEQVIFAPFTIQEVTSVDLQVEGHISGVDVELLKQEISDFHSEQEQSVMDLRLKAEEIAGQVTILDGIGHGATYELKDIVLTQILNTSGFVVDAPDNLVHIRGLEVDGLEHIWTWATSSLTIVQRDVIHHSRAGFVSEIAVDGSLVVPSSHPWKYSSAELSLLHLMVTAEIEEELVRFTRTREGIEDMIRQHHPGVAGVRLFTTGDDVMVLLYFENLVLCGPGSVRILVWSPAEPEPVPIQDIPGGDLDIGVFEVSGIQYMFLAGKSHMSSDGRNIQVFHRRCVCSRRPFTILTWLTVPGLLSVDLISVDGEVYLAATVRTSVDMYVFRGSWFRLVLQLPVVRALNAVALWSPRGELHLLVGQIPGWAHNLLFRVIWNGSRLGFRQFVRWL